MDHWNWSYRQLLDALYLLEFYHGLSDEQSVLLNIEPPLYPSAKILTFNVIAFISEGRTLN